MKFHQCAAVLLTGMLITAGSAEAKGCLTGAAVGGVAGHVAGHSVIGAGVGCVVGRHRANKKEKERAAAAQTQQQTSPAGSTVSPVDKK